MARSTLKRHLALTAIAALATAAAAAGPARAGQAWADDSGMQMDDGGAAQRPWREQAQSGPEDRSDMVTGSHRWREDGGDGRDHSAGWRGRWDGDRRDGPDRRSDGRMGGMMMQGMGGPMMHPPLPPLGARFDVEVGDAHVSVRCSARESSRDCVDAAVSLVTRLREATRPASPGSSSSSSGGSLGNGSNPQPGSGSSTQNPP